ncbi:hypothetical protein C8R47DRAFT_1078244 [Mycena vitilis]|nr:hypothetical protein C8R47DRAFT_1078244 [Mycena vitilis]
MTDVAMLHVARASRSPYHVGVKLCCLFLFAMPITPLSIEIYRRVATFCNNDDELLSLLLLSRRVYTNLLPVRYRNIWVGTDATRLVRSLAQNQALPPLVNSLNFWNTTAPVDEAQWVSVLPAMCNLTDLIITNRIPLSPELIPRLTFRLKRFGSSNSVEGGWVDLVASQTMVDELAFGTNFVGEIPRPALLPLLRSIKGAPTDLARFARLHPLLLDLWFYPGNPSCFSDIAPGQSDLQPADLQLFAASSVHLKTVRLSPTQFLLLLDAAPALFQVLEHLVLDEELEWSDFIVNLTPLREDGPLLQVAGRLSTVRALKTICLSGTRFTFERTRDGVHGRRLLERTDGPLLAGAMATRCAFSTARTFYLFGIDGIAVVNNWTTDDEEVLYRPENIWPSHFENHYAYLY